MPASIGVNLRVTGHCRQGGRKYMEDFFSVAYQQTEDQGDLEYAFFGIYDGHGGAEAAAFAKEHLMEMIVKQKCFWSENDDDVLKAIRDGYIATHYAMWKAQEKWPKTALGLPSTAGTTASIAFIRRGKIYIGHVGDSAIILGYQEPPTQGGPIQIGTNQIDVDLDTTTPTWKARPLTRDHKPENLDEMQRITACGGKVVLKSGVPRVVWNRPKMGHQGPVRRSTPIDEIPFLAVARSLGDLWSYNSQMNQFVVSPLPDCSVIEIDTSIHRCLIFGTDGLFNMLTPAAAVQIVEYAERSNEKMTLSEMESDIISGWLNPSRLLVEKALERWHATKMRADNTSVVTLILDPPGPPRIEVLKNRKQQTDVMPTNNNNNNNNTTNISTYYDDVRKLGHDYTSTLQDLDEHYVDDKENNNNHHNNESIQINEISSSSSSTSSSTDDVINNTTQVVPSNVTNLKRVLRKRKFVEKTDGIILNKKKHKQIHHHNNNNMKNLRKSIIENDDCKEKHMNDGVRRSLRIVGNSNNRTTMALRSSKVTSSSLRTNKNKRKKSAKKRKFNTTI